MSPKIAIAAAAAVLSAVATVQKGRAAKRKADFEAGILRDRADNERQISQLKAQDLKRKTNKILARQRAMLGNRGIQLAGAPLMVQVATAGEAEHQRQRLLAEGRIKAKNLEDTAMLKKQSGKDALMGSFLSAGAGLLQAGASGSKFLPSGSVPSGSVPVGGSSAASGAMQARGSGLLGPG